MSEQVDKVRAAAATRTRQAARLAARLASVWDEGHDATDEHGPRECECPNPYRASTEATT